MSSCVVTGEVDRGSDYHAQDLELRRPLQNLLVTYAIVRPTKSVVSNIYIYSYIYPI